MEIITEILNTPLIPIGGDSYLTLFTVLLILISCSIIYLFLLLLSKKVKGNRVERQSEAFEDFCRITEWQREAIPQILSKVDKTGENNYILNYIDENDVWYTDDIIDEDYNAIKRMNKVLFQEVQANVMQPNYCFMLLNTIDAMNGGLDVNDEGEFLPWISDSIVEGSIEEKLKAGLANALYNLNEKKLVPPSYINSAAQDIVESSIYNWTDETYKILILALCHLINDKFLDKQFSNSALSYIRILASCFDRSDYMDSLETLDD